MHRESLANRIRQEAEKESANLSEQQIEQSARILLPVLTGRREVVGPPAEPLHVRQ